MLEQPHCFEDEQASSNVSVVVGYLEDKEAGVVEEQFLP